MKKTKCIFVDLLVELNLKTKATSRIYIFKISNENEKIFYLTWVTLKKSVYVTYGIFCQDIVF